MLGQISRDQQRIQSGATFLHTTDSFQGQSLIWAPEVPRWFLQTDQRRVLTGRSQMLSGFLPTTFVHSTLTFSRLLAAVQSSYVLIKAGCKCYDPARVRGRLCEFLRARAVQKLLERFGNKAYKITTSNGIQIKLTDNWSIKYI